MRDCAKAASSSTPSPASHSCTPASLSARGRGSRPPSHQSSFRSPAGATWRMKLSGRASARSTSIQYVTTRGSSLNGGQASSAGMPAQHLHEDRGAAAPGPRHHQRLHARVEGRPQRRAAAGDHAERGARAVCQHGAHAQLEIAKQVERAEGGVEPARLGSRKVGVLRRERGARSVASRGVDHTAGRREFHVGDRFAVADRGAADVQRPAVAAPEPGRGLSIAPYRSPGVSPGAVTSNTSILPGISRTTVIRLRAS